MSDEQIIESIVDENKKLSIKEELDEIANENSINSAVSCIDALAGINKLKDYLMGSSFETTDSLNYLSKIEDNIFLSREKKTSITIFFHKL